MSIALVISFLSVAIFLTLAPGPDNLFVLAQSIAQDKKAGIITSCGLCTGLLVHITAATIGLSALIYQSVIIFTIVKFAGAIYLLYLAYKSFTSKESSINLESGQSIQYQSLYKRGIIMNILNPKVSIFFLALFPQFITTNGFSIPLQMFILGCIFLVQTLVIFTFISVFAGKVGQYLRKNETITKKMNIIQGSIFTFIGLSIAFSEN